ncbi:methyltransferase [Erythrobacter alti]|uniref:class I SAM-dependent methyltransferase n=1 Tax=Erythrobacter alti TaxID=1896145 RepID=UPI0030F4B0D0
MKGSDLAQQRRPGLGQRILRAMGPAGVFFRGFLEQPRMVGSIIPSSRVTIDAMLEPVDWQRCKLFVEYGPGVGTFCQPVLDRLPRGGELLVIDTNPLYIDYLKRTIRDSRFHAVLGSAEDVEQIVRSIGHEQADFVLSGLPFSTLPEGVGAKIVAATHRVTAAGGAFMTYQFKGEARDLTARYFPRVETGFVWRNIPPCVLAWGWKEGTDAS